MRDDYVEHGVFHRLAALVQVRDLYTPFALEVDESTTMREVIRRLCAAGKLGQPVLVCASCCSAPTSVLFTSLAWTPEEYDQDEDVSDQEQDTCELDAGSFLSADTTVIEALALMHKIGAHHAFAVLDGNSLAGVFRYSDLMKPAPRVCLFAMTIEFEAAALQLCSHFAQHCWAALTQQRQEKATKLFVQRFIPRLFDMGKKLVPYGESCLYNVQLDCTTLADKSTMIRKCKLTAESHSRIRDVFKRVERLRNACAHPGLIDDELPFEADSLVELIHDCHDLMDSFRRATPKPGGPSPDTDTPRQPDESEDA